MPEYLGMVVAQREGDQPWPFFRSLQLRTKYCRGLRSRERPMYGEPHSD